MTVIKINEENKVVAILRGAIAESAKVDNVTLFEVDSAPNFSNREELYFDPQNHTFSTVEISEEVLKARAEAYAKMNQSLKWFADNDWKVNKHILGEWADDDERWLEYLAGREKARKTYDEAMAVLLQNKD